MSKERFLVHLLQPKGFPKQLRQLSMHVRQVFVVLSKIVPSTHSVQEVKVPEHREHGGVHAVHVLSGLMIPLFVIVSQVQSPSFEGVSEKGALQVRQNCSNHLQVEHLLSQGRQALVFLKNPGVEHSHSPDIGLRVKLASQVAHLVEPGIQVLQGRSHFLQLPSAISKYLSALLQGQDPSAFTGSPLGHVRHFLGSGG